jgi:hypothetical protein
MSDFRDVSHEDEIARLREENERFRTALKDYAHPGNWSNRDEWIGVYDGPAVAKEALNPKPPTPEYTKEELQTEVDRLQNALNWSEAVAKERYLEIEELKKTVAETRAAYIHLSKTID